MQQSCPNVVCSGKAGELYRIASLAASYVVSRSQTFRLTAEVLECMVAFIGQGPPV